MDIKGIEQPITFNGYSDCNEYKGMVFPITTTRLEAFICIAPIILAVNDVDLVHTGFNHLMYGATSSFKIPDSEFSDLIVYLLNAGLVTLDNRHITLTKKGQTVIDYIYIVNKKVLMSSTTRLLKTLGTINTEGD